MTALVRRAQGHVAPPGLAAGAVHVRAVLDEDADELRAASAPHGVRDVRGIGDVRSVIEQEAEMLHPLVVEGVRERIGAVDGCAVLEQQAEAVGALVLKRVVDRLAVVRIGAGLEQDPRQLRIVRNAGCAVQR
jgi:hypothetical protein